jgi:hypothetical protein
MGLNAADVAAGIRTAVQRGDVSLGAVLDQLPLDNLEVAGTRLAGVDEVNKVLYLVSKPTTHQVQ